MLCCVVLYCAVLYCAVLYCAVLFVIILKNRLSFPHDSRLPSPVLFPEPGPDGSASPYKDWEGGCEDPRVVMRDDGVYVMTYTGD